MTPAMPMTEADDVLAALGDATRRAIHRIVLQGPQSVSALAQALGVTLTAISQHVRILQACGLLQTRKVGRVRICEMDRRGLDVLADWVALNRQLWDSRFDALDAMLHEGDGAQ
ncbi:transcriptional regulator, ArsR family [Pseudoduganella lurida]|uniref:Transcriptional regulator, ArsR family n=1 Tax=Pseudoduganella lurida TaxID=1036180 RepID=A0A562R2V3_9BURK|nr:metalloregulator ArsR/SmtB family transcription factor [Pseudoduganella lurida]TWI62904.1 transcriptional regulator, ArsR family [Pseudoduganella lurida]